LKSLKAAISKSPLLCDLPVCILLLRPRSVPQWPKPPVSGAPPLDGDRALAVACGEDYAHFDEQTYIKAQLF
jgi:hypothetical protein